MYSLLITLGIVVSVLLIVIVLLQASKGEGLAGITGGAPGSFGTVFGARRTADFLSRATWWLGGILFVIAIVTNLFFLPGQKTNEQLNSIIQSSRPSIPTTPALPLTKPINNNKKQTGTIPKK
jgi:preprotein translocase subunit SecG